MKCAATASSANRGCAPAVSNTPGAVIETELGTMRGSYQMVADDGTQFDAMIPTFVLTTPRTLH
jgi:ApaG protein